MPEVLLLATFLRQEQIVALQKVVAERHKAAAEDITSDKTIIPGLRVPFNPTLLGF